MVNVLSDEKKQQVEALGRLGWSLRRIEGHASPPGDSERVLEGRGCSRPRTGRSIGGVAAKTGHHRGGCPPTVSGRRWPRHPAGRRAPAPLYLDRWEENWADTRIHGTTKRQVAVMFAEEKPALRALPLEPFRYYRYDERTVNQSRTPRRGRF